jgi:hypothetical protein
MTQLIILAVVRPSKLVASTICFAGPVVDGGMKEVCDISA